MDEEKIETSAEETEDAFLEDWEDDSPSAEDTAAEPEHPSEASDAPQESAEEPSGEEAAPEEETPQEPPQEPQEAPKTWTLNRQGQPVAVGEADLAALAQRGLEYDVLRAELDESKPFVDFFRGFAEKANMTPREYLAALRTQAMQARGMTQEEARRAVELEDREAVVRQQEAAEQARIAQLRQAQEQARNLEAKRQAEVREFIAVFPDAAREPVPQEVWDGVKEGLSLTASYARYANAQAAEAARAAEEARQQAEAIQKQNAGNAARSVGSMRTSGNNHGPKDPFLEGWDE